jgi:3-oxoacyl-[acyl-carrier protein] reductase
MRLKGRKAIVTGAGQGIGRSIALKMAQEGADVVIAEMNPDTGTRTAKEVEALGRKALFVSVDVANPKQVQGMVDLVLRVWKRIDILVNNAGFDRPGNLLKVREEDWDAVMGVHLKGTLNCIQAVAPHMIENSYGKIVNLSSVWGKKRSRIRDQLQYCQSRDHRPDEECSQGIGPASDQCQCGFTGFYLNAHCF